MKTFALVVAYYENAGMLDVQFRTLEAEPWVKNYIEFVCTDDGSTINPAKPKIDSEIEHKIFRIVGRKVAWGHNVCRNIGVEHSKAPWILQTDIDHVVPPDTWAYLLKRVPNLSKDKPYRLSRVNAPNREPYHRHPDSHLMHRDFFKRMGGFDEAGRGVYGQNSLVLQAMLRAARMKSEEEIEVLPCPIIRYSRDVLPDASTTQFERKSKANKEAMKAIRTAKAARGKTGIAERFDIPYEAVFT